MIINAGVYVEPYTDDRRADLLRFLTEHCSEHPELGEGTIVDWQKCDRWIAVLTGEIVGYGALIKHDFKYSSGEIQKIGWGVSLVLDMRNDDTRKAAGRGIFRQFYKEDDYKYAAVGVVKEIEGFYKRTGCELRKNGNRMYARLFKTGNTLVYTKKTRLLNPLIKAGNILMPPKIHHPFRLHKMKSFNPWLDSIWEEYLERDYLFYGTRTADFLNYKISQPNKDYQIWATSKGNLLNGYIIFRMSMNKVKDLKLVRICDLVGDRRAKPNLIAQAVKYAKDNDVDGIVAIDSSVDRKTYRKAGLWLSRPYLTVVRPEIKAEMRVSLLDSDLDNLW